MPVTLFSFLSCWDSNLVFDVSGVRGREEQSIQIVLSGFTPLETDPH